MRRCRYVALHLDDLAKAATKKKIKSNEHDNASVNCVNKLPNGAYLVEVVISPPRKRMLSSGKSAASTSPTSLSCLGLRLSSWSSDVAPLPTLEGNHASLPSSEDSGVKGTEDAVPNRERKPPDEGDKEISKSSRGDVRRECGDADETAIGNLCPGVVRALDLSFGFAVVLLIVEAMKLAVCAAVAACGGPCLPSSVAIIADNDLSLTPPMVECDQMWCPRCTKGRRGAVVRPSLPGSDSM